MEWKGRERSTNVQDRRGGGGKVAGGGIGLLIVAAIVFFLTGDPNQALQIVGEGGAQSQAVQAPIDDADREFVEVVLKDTEDVWHPQFRALGKTYREPQLVLFSGQVQSACGFASAAVGPFYCSLDETIYLDTSFFDELERWFGAAGDFAPAYVIAHEVGHHVQHLLGISEPVQKAKQRGAANANDLSVRLELQADFFAGVWAHHTEKMKGVIEPGDIEEAITAAEAIGDDKLQMEAQGYVVPDSFTHGTSEQRMRWFMKGWETGDLSQGDTFRARRL